MTTIIFKFSSVAAKVPLPTDLQIGELALNTADGKVYMKLNDGSIKAVLG
jgi:hypothetical protein